MTMDFWLGYCLGVLSLIALAVVVHLWAQKGKAVAASVHPRRQDIQSLQLLLKLEAKDGLSTAQVMELNGILTRLQRAPIQPLPQARKDIH